MEILPDDLFIVEKDISIDLYTLKNRIEPQTLVHNDTKSIEESNFNKDIPTRIFVHGFHSKTGSLRNAFIRGKACIFSRLIENLKIFFSLFAAYFNEKNRNVNLIYINWEEASSVNYVTASRYVKRIGLHLSEFVDFMVIMKTTTK